jgi:hypothetical protein
LSLFKGAENAQIRQNPETYFVTISVFSLYTVGCVTTTADVEEVNTTSRKLVLL